MQQVQPITTTQATQPPVVTTQPPVVTTQPPVVTTQPPYVPPTTTNYVRMYRILVSSASLLFKTKKHISFRLNSFVFFDCFQIHFEGFIVTKYFCSNVIFETKKGVGVSRKKSRYINPLFPAPVHPTNFCKGKSDGFYKDPANCSFFYQCSFQTSYHEPCPQGTYFSESLSGCDWAANVPSCP